MSVKKIDKLFWLWYFGFTLKPIFATAPAVLRNENDSNFKSGQM